ncbi:FAD-binding protein [Candidatus Odyssella acanthamoebae]|uniref:FAD-linked oxidase n=1 Tax=Candidatus Odyssella acanthamoebae TaxID=91604 RepID=A0A077AT60_9PROT|nr:FAD-binding protein [Candidatus Paracaedibacter acanthamoebae]AIK95556.1 FAD-linked oxidase [Candidatus Paracaedibacter acanthamoebae]
MKLRKATKIIIVLVLLIVSVYLSTEPKYAPPSAVTPPFITHFPTFIAHKSIISNKSHPNTIDAIEEVLMSEVPGIEVDVRLSKDGIPFIYHGNTLEEETNGVGIPEDQVWTDLEKLTYKNTTNSKIMTLESLLTTVGSKKFIFLDIKTYKIFNQKLALAITALINKYQLQETIFVESFNPFLLLSVRLTAPDILIMYDFTTSSEAPSKDIEPQFKKIPWLLKQPFIQKQIRRIIRPDLLSPRFNINEDMLKSIISNGYPVVASNIDTPQAAQGLLDIGVKGIQTNKSMSIIQRVKATSQATYDAGGSGVIPSKIIHVQTVEDIVEAVQLARSTQKKITIAGLRHSMGGHTLLDNSIQLDTLGFKKVTYNPETMTVNIEPGATWKRVQKVLDRYGRSVKVMQGDNIFTVGGTISINIHGWQTNSAPLASTVVSLKVLTADGKIHHLHRDDHSLLFRAVLGGYGLFGLIINVELETAPNTALKFKAEFIDPNDFTQAYEKYVTQNPKAELAYGRLCVDKHHLFKHAGLYWYEQTHADKLEDLKFKPPITDNRGILRASETYNWGKKLRWSAEKTYVQRMLHSNAISRNNAMNTDIQILWPIYRTHKDVLQEFLVPKQNLNAFVASLKKHILDFKINILHVTIREVKQDHISLLPYAKTDMFGLLCAFSQGRTPDEEKQMRQFTQKVIDDLLQLNGVFFLPYRLHYTKEQLLTAYPEIKEWVRLKKTLDSENMFDSEFFQYVSKDED